MRQQRVLKNTAASNLIWINNVGPVTLLHKQNSYNMNEYKDREDYKSLQKMPIKRSKVKLENPNCHTIL